MSSSAQAREALARTVDRLHRVVDATKLLNSTLDLMDLTGIILQIVRNEVGVERGSVFVMTPDRRHLRSLVAQGVDSEIKVRLGSGIAGTVAQTGQVVDIPGAYDDARFDPSFDAQLGFRTRDIYCMPIHNREGNIVGVLELLNRSRAFTDVDQDFLSGISVHIGLALENAAMHRQIVENKRIEQELALAQEIQQAFRPKLPESFGGVQIAGSSEMCTEVGGDYYAVFPLEDGRFIAALGDVSGKGIGAALVMTSVHAMCRALVRHVHALERIAYVLNEMLLESTRDETFLTLLIMLADPRNQRIHFIRAGHNPPLLIDGAGSIRLLEQGGGPPLGLFRGVRYEREILEMAPRSTLVIYTDGVSEAAGDTGEQFGLGRLAIAASVNCRESAATTHAAIRTALRDFTGETPRGDDSTMIVLKF